MKKVYQQFRSLFTGRFRIASVLSISLLAMLLLQVAGASARSISQNAVYYACANYKTGKIYVIQQNGNCKPGYTLIQWNQTGPQGPSGLSQGYAGIGGSTVYLSANPIVVATTNAVPAPSDIIGCFIEASDGTIGHTTSFAGGGSQTQYMSLAITDSISVSAGSTISLACFSEAGNTNSYIYWASITAIQLNAVDSNAHPMGHKLTPPTLPHH